MSKYNPIFIILIIALFVGIVIYDEYGESWDEESLQKYAIKSLAAYETWPREGKLSLEREDLAYYGPFYVMAVEAITSRLNLMFRPYQADLRHLMYFLTYLGGVLAFYMLAIRWLRMLPAIGATLLFMTQPLLWGHAFINPKDTPFLSLFMLSLAFGFRMEDFVQPVSFDSLTSSAKRTLTLLTAFWLATIFPLFIFTEAIRDYIATLVLSGQAGGTNIITLIAKNITAVPAEIYVQRYFLIFLQARTFFFLLFTALLLFVWYRLQPKLTELLPDILLPAILLGFATSTRILGPFAGLIVAFFLIYRMGKQAFPTLAVYIVIAMITTYLTWPYLWMNPVGRFFESLGEMALYPWMGTTLFNGVTYSSTELPFFYLPVLFVIQLTEPVWVLFIAGLIAAIYSLETKRGLILLSLLWFFIPFVALIVFRVALYDNFRQILFILPPVFLLGGVAIEKLKDMNWQIAAITICLIPSAVGLLNLHPFEYIYYNSFIGGVEGAHGRFELDYWGTSYRYAAGYVNREASPNAAIWVEGPAQLFEEFAREDLKIYSWHEAERADNYEYVVSLTRYDLDKKSFPDAEVVYEIAFGEAVLARIKKP
jgi:hypothetical protein